MSFMPADTELEACKIHISSLYGSKFLWGIFGLSLLNDMGYSIMFQFVLIVYKK